MIYNIQEVFKYISHNEHNGQVKFTPEVFNEGKKMVEDMGNRIMAHFAWDDYPAWHNEMAKYFAEEFTYDFGAPDSNYSDIHEWW
eukprot:Pgem_evm1s4560